MRGRSPADRASGPWWPQRRSSEAGPCAARPDGSRCGVPAPSDVVASVPPPGYRPPVLGSRMSFPGAGVGVAVGNGVGVNVGQGVTVGNGVGAGVAVGVGVGCGLGDGVVAGVALGVTLGSASGVAAGVAVAPG